MNILIRTLLLTIAFFLNFGELNASGYEREGSSYRRGRKGNVPEAPVCLPNKFVAYGPHMIGLWLDSSRKIVLKADYSGNYVPYGLSYYKMHNLLIRLISVEGLKFVGYINQDATLLGVRAPKLNAGSRILEPTESMWYISYSAKKFKVKINPATGHLLGIHLMPSNLHVVEHTSQQVLVAGIRFLVFRGHSGEILGSALPQKDQ